MSSVSLLRDEDGLELPLGGPGEYTLGRGPLVKITDKRVSRNHALLCLGGDDGDVKLCPKHSNPFFHKTCDEDSFVALTKDNWHQIQDGDKISFLPNELIFTVRLNVPAKKSKGVSSISTSTAAEETAVDRVTLPLPDVGETESGQQDNPSTSLDHPPPPPSQSPPSQSLSVNGGTGKKRNLPSWLMGVPVIAPKKKAKDIKPPVKKPATKSSTTELSGRDNEENIGSVSSSSLEAKISNTTRKLETTPVDTAAPDKKPVKTITKKEADRPDSAGGGGKKLPPCPYGKKCYRKNPAHFMAFSHSDNSDDDDDDDDEEDKPECPYGTSCYRSNPSHRSQFKHTAPPAAAAGAKRGRTSTRTRKKPKMSVLSGDSDDEGEPNTYDYNDSFIDDGGGGGGDSSSTSFRGDSEDDDWSPPPPPDSGEEDMSELVSEATSFMTNKKMHRTT